MPTIKVEMPSIPANALREGDILEPDGTVVLRVQPELFERDGRRLVTVTIKPPHKRKAMYELDPLWPLIVREPRPDGSLRSPKKGTK